MPKITDQAYTFSQNDTAPILHSVNCFASHPLQDKIARCQCSTWAIDYTWTPCFNTRVGSTRKPWRSRKAKIAYLYQPKTVFWEDYTTAKPGISGMYLTFSKGHVAGLKKLITPKTGYSRFDDSDEILGKIFFQIYSAIKQRGANSFHAIQAYMWQIFDVMLTAKHVKNEDYLVINRQPVIKESLTMKIENFMREHYSEKISLDDISDFFNLSPATLSRRFKDDNKISPMARLKEIRIEIAKTMLLKGEKLYIIAEKTGFSDEYHLSKTFKKITTQSPREFIKTIDM